MRKKKLFSQFATEGDSGFKQPPAAIITQANVFGSVEPLPDEYTPDKYTWEGVFARIKKGTYAKEYSIGDLVPLDLGSEGLINMQIAAFDKDDLADGSGKAHITWIAKELLPTKLRMNPYRVSNGDGTYQEGTGSIGGWEKSEMRAYIKNSIRPMLPDIVRNSIKEVRKNQIAQDTTGVSFEQTTVEDIWIPSMNEVFGTESMYYDLFRDTDTNRCKIIMGTETTTVWWLRDGKSATDFQFVYGTGDLGSNVASLTYRVALGFCT